MNEPRPRPIPGGHARANTPPRSTEPASEPADPGTSFEVTWGEELFQPIQYHTLRVGPFRASGVVRAGESLGDAVYRVWLALNEVAMRTLDEKAAQYNESTKRVIERAGR